MANEHKKTIGIAEIAQELKVSQATVSLVMNGRGDKLGVSKETQNKVLELAKKLNYRPNRWAQQLSKQRSNVVSVLFADLRNNWAQDILEGMGPVLEKADYIPLIGTHNYDSETERKEIEQAISRRDDGLLCQPIPIHIDIYLKLLEERFPFVFVGDSLEKLPNASSVAWDCTPAARKAVEHLIDRGCRRVGFVGSRIMTNSHINRYRAYREVLNDSGLEVNEDLVCTAEGLVCPTLDIKKIEHLFKNTSKSPDGFFALNDSLAYPLLSALRRIGVKVPDDVAVIGMCDLPLSGEHGAKLTTIREPLQSIGNSAAEMLLDLIEHPKSSPHIELIKGGELIARETA